MVANRGDDDFANLHTESTFDAPTETQIDPPLKVQGGWKIYFAISSIVAALILLVIIIGIIAIIAIVIQRNKLPIYDCTAIPIRTNNFEYDLSTITTISISGDPTVYIRLIDGDVLTVNSSARTYVKNLFVTTVVVDSENPNVLYIDSSLNQRAPYDECLDGVVEVSVLISFPRSRMASLNIGSTVGLVVYELKDSDVYQLKNLNVDCLGEFGCEVYLNNATVGDLSLSANRVYLDTVDAQQALIAAPLLLVNRLETTYDISLTSLQAVGSVKSQSNSISIYALDSFAINILDFTGMFNVSGSSVRVDVDASLENVTVITRNVTNDIAGYIRNNTGVTNFIAEAVKNSIIKFV